MTTQRNTLRDLIDSTAYTAPERSLNFHVSMVDYRDAENIRRILQAAGIEAIITPVTQERDGIILTDQLASFTWESQTGNWNCDGSCRAAGEPPHRDFRHLTPEQRHGFTERLMDNMNSMRGDLDMDMSEITRMEPNTATTDCN